MCLKKSNYIILYQMEFILFYCKSRPVKQGFYVLCIKIYFSDKHLSLHLFVLDLGLHLLNALFSMTDVFSATVR